jgi:tRNA(Arg) A34 adenosine deaminase TadA
MALDRRKKELLMREVIKEVDKAVLQGNAPFGALLVDHTGTIVYRAHNTTTSTMDPTAHAEVNIIRKACADLQTKNLSLFTLVSNAQSCPMCFSASVKAKISNFLYGYAEDETLIPRINVHELKERVTEEIAIETNILEEECRSQVEKGRKIII